jgi:hypothetical protein
MKPGGYSVLEDLWIHCRPSRHAATSPGPCGGDGRP